MSNVRPLIHFKNDFSFQISYTDLAELVCDNVQREVAGANFVQAVALT
jgi:hypothetical protein